MKKIVVGVSGINATDNPGPGVGIARSLKEASSKVKILGLSYDPHDPGHYMDFVIDDSVILPYPTKGWSLFRREILELKERFGMNALIPALDAELPLYIKHQKELDRMGILHFLPTPHQFNYRIKSNLPMLCKKIGWSHPATAAVNSVDELVRSIREGFEFPLVIKGNLYKAYVVYNMESAIMKFTEISGEWGFPILVQGMVYGNEINLCGLGDGEGRLCGQVSIKKLLTTNLGKIWTGITISDSRLAQMAEQFVKGTRWKGPFELECIQKGQDYYLIEINPRFPAWVYFGTAVGINLPARLLDLMVKGKCDQKRHYQVGKYLVRYSYELVTDLENFSAKAMQQNSQLMAREDEKQKGSPRKKITKKPRRKVGKSKV